MTAPAWMVEAARARRRRPAQIRNWVSDPSLPMAWGEGDALVAMAARINEPYHRRLAKPMERIGEVEITSVGSDTG